MRVRRILVGFIVVALIGLNQPRAALAAQDCVGCRPLRTYGASLYGSYAVQIWSSEDPTYSITAPMAGQIESGIISFVQSFFYAHDINIEFDFTYCQVDGEATCPASPDIVIFLDDAANMVLGPEHVAETQQTSDGRGAHVRINNDFLGSFSNWNTLAAHEFMHILGFGDLEPTQNCPQGSSIMHPLGSFPSSRPCADLAALTENYVTPPLVDEAEVEKEITGEGCWDVWGQLVYICDDGESSYICGYSSWRFLGNTCIDCCYWMT